MTTGTEDVLKEGESFAYSTSDDGLMTDGFKTREEAMTEGFEQHCEDDPEEYPGICTAIVKRAEHRDHYPTADLILERMREIAFDNGGEFADDYLERVKPEQEADLERRVGEALDAFFNAQNIPTPRYFKVHRADQYHKYEPKPEGA